MRGKREVKNPLSGVFRNVDNPIIPSSLLNPRASLVSIGEILNSRKSLTIRDLRVLVVCFLLDLTLLLGNLGRSCTARTAFWLVLTRW